VVEILSTNRSGETGWQVLAHLTDDNPCAQSTARVD
jgi:hypothetical protein